MQAIVDLVKAAEKAADKPPTKAAPKGGRGKDVVVTDDVLKRIETQVKSSDVMLFMKGTPSAPRCRFSGQAAKTLKAAGVDFSAVDVLEDPMIREGIKVYSAFPTIPQAYVFAWCSLLGVTAVRAWDLRRSQQSPFLSPPCSSPFSTSFSPSHVFPLPRRRYVKGQFVGGCDILAAMFKDGALQKLLEEKNVARKT
jgi:Grx4 family monothiol glutaredoxin